MWWVFCTYYPPLALLVQKPDMDTNLFSYAMGVFVIGGLGYSLYLFIKRRRRFYALPKEERADIEKRRTYDSITTFGFLLMAGGLFGPLPLYLQIAIFGIGLGIFIWAVNQNTSTILSQPHNNRLHIKSAPYLVPLWTAIALAIIATGLGFWWYQLRPASIKSACSWTTATYDKNLVVSASPNQYQSCLRHHGL